MCSPLAFEQLLEHLLYRRARLRGSRFCPKTLGSFAGQRRFLLPGAPFPRRAASTPLPEKGYRQKSRAIRRRLLCSRGAKLRSPRGKLFSGKRRTYSRCRRRAFPNRTFFAGIKMRAIASKRRAPRPRRAALCAQPLLSRADAPGIPLQQRAVPPSFASSPACGRWAIVQLRRREHG
jgi:hypothetical protein